MVFIELRHLCCPQMLIARGPYSPCRSLFPTTLTPPQPNRGLAAGARVGAEGAAGEAAGGEESHGGQGGRRGPQGMRVCAYVCVCVCVRWGLSNRDVGDSDRKLATVFPRPVSILVTFPTALCRRWPTATCW